jgi:acyl-coenzyme A synthetase/AMP-(fatty) acid ligase
MDVVNPMVRWLQKNAKDDPEGFWAQRAEALPWFRRWDRVLDWTPPTFRWFVGAETNLAWNCVDRHVTGGRSGHAAIIGLNELGERRTLTYGQLLREVERVAAALRGLGIRRGDRVTVCMPTSIEAIVLADEIIKIAGHRIGAIEVETSFLRHPACAEAGVTGRPDDLRGEVISAFVVLRKGHAPSDEVKAELLATVRAELGPVAVIPELQFVSMLPKTRSGKIMRRVLKAIVMGNDVGDVSTIEDEGSVEEAHDAFLQMVQELTEARVP